MLLPHNSRLTFVISSGKKYVQEAFEYDEFNNRTKKTVTQTDGTYVTEYGYTLSAGQTDNPFKFAGEHNDDETGLIYLRNRYYDPTTGRFISEDPAMDGNNWYVYCNNNPINFVDPWGLDSVIFVDSTMVNQAYVRSDHYKELYNTPVTIYQVDSPKEFVDSWNKWVAKTKKSKIDTDAVEIIAHGGIVDEKGSGVGYIIFSGYNVYAKDNASVSKNDRLISNLNYLEANEINVNPCNSANPDIYNVVYAIMQVTDSDWYSGFDGGSEWSDELKDHKRGNGEYGEGWRSIFDAAYYVRTYQSGWYRYVDKDRLGMPLRERLGRRIFDNTNSDY